MAEEENGFKFRNLSSFSGHDFYIFSIICIGDEIISSGRDYTIHVFELNSGKCKQVLKEHTREVYWLEKVTDTKILSTSRDKNVIEWKKKVRKGRSRWKRNHVFQIRYNPIRFLCNVRGSQKEIDFLGKDSDGEMYSFSEHNKPRMIDESFGKGIPVYLSERDRNCFITTRADQRSILLYNFLEEETVMLYDKDENWNEKCSCIHVFQNFKTGEEFAVVAFENIRRICLWNTSRSEIIKILVPTSQISCILHNDKHLFCGANGAKLEIFDLDTSERVSVIRRVHDRSQIQHIVWTDKENYCLATDSGDPEFKTIQIIFPTSIFNKLKNLSSFALCCLFLVGVFFLTLVLVFLVKILFR